MMMLACAEMIDRSINDPVLVKPVDEVDIARALPRPEVPRAIPEVQRVRGHRFLLMGSVIARPGADMGDLDG